MTAGERKTLVGGLAAGAIVAVLVVFPVLRAKDDDTQIQVLLRPDGASCRIAGKPNEVVVSKGNKLIWQIRNYCNTAKTLAVGDFRLVGAQPAPNCTAPSSGNTRYPFRDADQDDRQEEVEAVNGQGQPGKAKLQLRVKNRGNGDDQLPDELLEYDFNVCLDGARVDPRLIVER